MTKYLLGLISLWLMCSCSDTDPGETPPIDPPTPTPTVTITKPEFVFGFQGQSKYSYCPSALKQADGTVHLYFCVPGSWDDHHTCDPSVIEGNFTWKNTTYKYAMFFLSNMYGVYYNEIGVAFSNDLDADSWVKYPQQIVKKTWSSEGDQEIGGGGKSWGVGQPSVVSLDGKGKLLLTYTVGDIGGTRIVWAEADFSNMDTYSISTPQTIVQTGLKAIDNQSRDYTCNSEFAIDKNADKIVMIRPIQPMPNDYPNYLNSSLEIDYMNLSDFTNQRGNWTQIYRITPDDTGYPRNHNATLLRDNFGHLQDWEEPEFYFTVSKAAPEVQPSGSNHAEWTYHIWKSKVVK